MLGYSQAVSAVAQSILADIPQLSSRIAHKIAADLQRFPIRTKHHSGTGKAWHHEMIRDRYGRDATRILVKSGIFQCTDWNHFTNTQRRWTLTERGTEYLRQFHTADTKITPPAPAESPEQATKRGRPRTRAINRTDKAGNRAANVSAISRKPDFNAEHIRESLPGISAEIEATSAALKTATGDDLTRLTKQLSKLETTRAQLQAALDGEVTHDYRETGPGRLQGQGIHFQHFTKKAKAICFPQAFDIDIENCHPTIIAQLAKQHDITTPALQDYIANKNHWRQSIAEQTGLHIDDVKSGLISLCYGAQVSGSKYTSIVETLGSAKAKRFNSHSKIKALHAELKRATSAIVKDARATANRSGNIANACGKKIHKSKSPKRITAHIVQGLESFLMQSVIEEIGCEVQVWLHDGVIVCEAITPAQLIQVQQEIRRRTGFLISLDVTPLNAGFRAVEQCRANSAPNESHSHVEKNNPPQEQREREGEGRKEEGERRQAPLTDMYSSKPLFFMEFKVLNFGLVHRQKSSTCSTEKASSCSEHGDSNDPPERSPP